MPHISSAYHISYTLEATLPHAHIPLWWGAASQDIPDEGLANKLNKEADIHLKAFAFTADNFHKTLHTYTLARLSCLIKSSELDAYDLAPAYFCLEGNALRILHALDS